VQCSAAGTYTVQNGGIALGPLRIKTSEGDYSAFAATLYRVPGTSRFRGVLNLVDGKLWTSWPDYTKWTLEIGDDSDINRNAVPDIVDAPIEAPRITIQPKALTVIAGQTAILSVTASGSSPLTYQWQRNGVDVIGGTGATLQVVNAQSIHAGDYQVIVKNPVGSIASTSVRLTVNPLVIAPSLSVQPQPVTVTAGERVEFAVVAAGTAPLAFQWQLNGVNVQGATSSVLVLEGVMASQAGSYRVVVKNAAGSVLSSAALLMVKPVTKPLVVNVNGAGSVAPNLSGQQLEIGKTYSATAIPAPGWVLANWTSNVLPPTNRNPLVFTMVKDLVIAANFVDAQKPMVAISSPTVGQRVLTNNPVWQVRGTASDNGSVSNVWVSLNKGAWTKAAGTTSWGVTMPLVAGPNEIKAYAEDAFGNRSLTNGISFTYVVTAPLTLKTNGNGSINPNLAGKQLEIGTQQTLSAAPAPGWVLANWTSNLLPPTNRNPLVFTMVKDLVITANFVDAQKPALVVSSPVANSIVNDPGVQLAGMVTDNGGAVQLRWRLDAGPWQGVSANGAFKANLQLNPGVNVLSVCAVDQAGNSSPTNSMEVTCLKGIARLYLPLNNGDWFQWDGPKGRYGGETYTRGGDDYTFVQWEPHETTASVGFRHGNQGRSLIWLDWSQDQDWYLDPAVTLFTAEIIASGGTWSESTMAHVQGVGRFPLRSVVVVTKAGTVAVPAGNFRHTRQVDWTVTADIPKVGSRVILRATLFLAPKVGLIRASDYNQVGGSVVFQGWMNLVDGRVGGVDVRELAGALPGIGFSSESQLSSSATPSDSEQHGLASGDSQLEWMQDGAGVERLVLSGRSDRVYHIERGLRNADGAVQWEPYWTVVIPQGERLEIPIDPDRPSAWYRAVEH